MSLFPDSVEYLGVYPALPIRFLSVVRNRWRAQGARFGTSGSRDECTVPVTARSLLYTIQTIIWLVSVSCVLYCAIKYSTAQSTGFTPYCTASFGSSVHADPSRRILRRTGSTKPCSYPSVQKIWRTCNSHSDCTRTLRSTRIDHRTVPVIFGKNGILRSCDGLHAPPVHPLPQLERDSESDRVRNERERESESERKTAID
jgi:hypothetical protein